MKRFLTNGPAVDRLSMTRRFVLTVTREIELPTERMAFDARLRRRKEMPWSARTGRVEQESGRTGFRDVFESNAFDESTIARYFSPRYAQRTDGNARDFPGFAAHIRELKRTLKNVRITFERVIAEGSNVVSIHRARSREGRRQTDRHPTSSLSS